MKTHNLKLKTNFLHLIFLLSFVALSACATSESKTHGAPADTSQEMEVKTQQCMVAGKEQSCAQCHTLNEDEATEILSIQGPKTIKVLNIKNSQVPGLWEVFFNFKGRRTIAYIDYSKKYLISGVIIDHEQKENITQKRLEQLNRVDVSRIPTDKALLLGNADATYKVFVFDDPECGYCKKLHGEMKKVVEQNPDIAFYIKLFPLPMHRMAYGKAVTIACKNSLQLMEDNFAGKQIPETKCDTTEVDDNLKLGEEFGITGTPTLIFPNGVIMPGYMEAEALIKKILENAQ
jgi:thiol:disulfide interchange protein DsbC